MITTGGTILIGDWRRRRGTKTDAHLYRNEDVRIGNAKPICGKRIDRWRTDAVRSGRPCTDCLVAAITKRA